MRSGARAISLLLLVALLTGVLIAGTPVNGDRSSAAKTAGIHLTTPPAARAIAATPSSASVPAIVLAAAVVVVTLVAPVVLRSVVPTRRPHGRADARRGPPITA